MTFTPLGDTLFSKISSNSGLKRQIESSGVVELSKKIFEEIFGQEVGAQVRPLFLKNRTLTVSCGSSVVAQEIRLRQMEIVEKINQEAGKSEIDRIRYLT